MFKFKLETLLNYRQILEDSCHQEFSQSKKIWQNQRQALINYNEQWKKCMEELRTIQNKFMSIHEISLYQKYMVKLKHEIFQQAERVRSALDMMEKNREKLLVAQKDKKIMEKIKDKSQKEYMTEQVKIERKFLDEISTLRFNPKGFKE